MEKLVILANFKVDVANPGENPDGSPKAATVVPFTKGMVVAEDEVPEGQSAQDWIDKGLAERGRGDAARTDIAAI
jgi:hypothetical protein